MSATVRFAVIPVARTVLPRMFSGRAAIFPDPHCPSDEGTFPYGRNRPENGIAAKRRLAQNVAMRRRVVFVIYPGITALDLVGPHEVFGASGGYDVEVVATAGGQIATTRGLAVVADRSFGSVRGL